MQVAILAHEKFPDRAKTALGILRYGDHEVVGVLDRDRAGDRVADHVSDVQDAPIVASMSELPDPDALVIGVAPIGGGFDESWRPDVRSAIERGCDVIAGLHYFLNDDDELAALAEKHGVELRDVRAPPDDLTVADGDAGAVDARVVLTVGTDCSSGKMTTAYMLRDCARERGLDAAVAPTGQTGIMISGWGIAVDRVVSDFAAGATERLVKQLGDRDVVFVEGQGALCHPAYSGVTTAIVHGSQPDSMVLCHVAGNERVGGYPEFELPAPPAYANLYEEVSAPVSEASVDAGAINTSDLDESDADRAIDEFGDALGVPATDPVARDPDVILDAVLE